MPIRITDDLLLETANTAASGEIAGEAEHTIGFWFYLETGTETASAFSELMRFGRAIFFSKSSSATTNRFRFLLATESSGSVSYTVDGIPYDTWTFVLFRTKTGATEVYIDDVLEGSSKTNAYTEFDTSTTSNTIRYGCRSTNGIIAGGIRYNGIFQMNHYVSDVDKTALYNGTLNPQDVVGPTFSFIIPMDNEDTGDAIDIDDVAFDNLGDSSYEFTSLTASSGESRVVGNNHSWSILPPALQSATIEEENPNQVILVFNNSVSGTEAGFSLSGTTSTVFDSLSIDGSMTNTLIATLSDSAVAGETITLDYDAGSIGDIIDEFDVDLADITSFSVTNNVIERVLPTLQSATIEDANPDQVILVFSEDVLGSKDGFSLSGTTSTIFDSLSVNGSETDTLIAILSNEAVFGETITLDYSPGSNGTISDLNNNDLADIVSFSVTNNVADVDLTAPTLQSATVEDANPDEIVLVFDENVLIANTGWTVNGTTSTGFDSVSGSGTDTITVTLSDNVVYTETITLDYLEASGGVTDTSFNDLVDISGYSVTNNTVEKVAPTLDSATVEDANPNKLVLVFSEIVIGTNLGFTLSGTTSTTFDSILGFGTDTITATLSDNVVYTETVTLDYVSATGDITDASVNDLADISSYSVTNNTLEEIFTERLDVYEHGDESLVRFQLNGGAGAWLDRAFSFNSGLFSSSFKIFADGIEVDNIEIIAESTPQSDNPNAADLWPHISDDDYGTVGNYIEIWVKHDIIEYGATVTWSCAADVLTQGGFGSGSASLEAAKTQASTYLPNFEDYIDSAARGIFLSSSGTSPKLPYLEKDLPSPDYTYANDSDINGTEINGTVNGLFCIDVTFDQGATGTIFEIGDSLNGISVFLDDGSIVVKAGDSVDSVTLSRTIGTTGFLPLEQRFILGIYVDKDAGDLTLYVEGSAIITESGTIGTYASEGSSSSDGHVGGVSGDFISEENPSQAPTQEGITIHTSLRYYEDPTLAIGIDVINSSDYFSHGYNTTARDLYEGEPWESELTKYEYTASDFADIRNPGVINELSSIQAARGLSSWVTGGFSLATKNVFWAFKSGDTWTNSNDHLSSTNVTDSGHVLDSNCTGTGVTTGVIYMRYGGTDLVTFDWSAHPTGTGGMPGVLSLREKSYVFVEDRVFKFIGNGETDSEFDGGGINITCNGSDIQMHTYRIGGIWFKNTASTAISYISNGSIENDSNVGGHTWGEMCFDSVGENWFRNACFVTGSDQYGNLQRVQLGKSYFDIGWAGATQDQAHGAYSKGYVPYLRIKGGWTPPGPGAAWKMDSAGLAVIEDFVSVFHTPLGFHNNGEISAPGEPWEEVTDRSKGAGRHGKHVCFQDFVAGNIDIWAMDMCGAVNCEARRGILLGPNDNLMGFWRDNTTSSNNSTTGGGSDKWGNYAGDNWNSGYQELTTVGNTGMQIRLPWSDDRANSTHAGGSHYCYINKTLSITNGNPVVECNSWNDPYEQTYIEAAAAGRITDFIIAKSHLSGSFEENGVDIGNLAVAKTIFEDAGVSMLKDTNQEGSVTLFDADPTEDIMLEYLIANGYASYTEFEDAIVSSWEGGWDTVPSELQTENMRNNIFAMVTPTNLDEADYGGVMPGYQIETNAPFIQSITIEDSNPNEVVIVFNKNVSGTEAGFSLSGTTSTVFDSITINGSETDTLIGVISDAAVFGENITLSYDAGSIGDIEDEFGNQLENVSGFIVTNLVGTTDVTAPTIQSITIEDISPNEVVIVFDEIVTGTNLGFTLSGTTSTGFDTIIGSGSDTIIGILSDAAVVGEIISLDYSSGSIGDIQDISGNMLDDVSGYSVTNNTVEKVLPTFDFVRVQDASPDRIIMTFSETVTGTNVGFRISGTTSDAFTSLSGSGTNTLTGILSDNVVNGEVITLDYDAGSLGDIQDLAGNQLEDVSSLAVLNLVSETDPPVIQSATVENSNPLRVVLAFDEGVAGAINGFDLYGTTSTGFIGISGSGSSTLSMSLSDPIVAGEILTLNYTNKGGGIADSHGNFMEAFTGMSITNNVIEVIAPTLQSATVENSNPNQMVLTFDEAVDISTVGFSFTGTGSNDFLSVEFSGSEMDVVLANFEKPVESTNVILLSYSAGSFGDTADLVGNILEDFVDFPVTNNVLETDAPNILSAVITNEDRDQMLLTFDEAVNLTNLGFTLSGTTSVAFDSLSGSGTDMITAILSDDAAFGEVITLDYDANTGDIADLVGNTHKGFSGYSVTNNIGDAVAPVLQSATIEDANPDQIVLVFDEDVTGSTLGFTLSGTTSTIIDSFVPVGGDTNILTGILSSDALQDEVILLSYSSGSIVDLFSNPLADIVDLSVTNNAIDDDDPILLSTYPENDSIDIPLTPTIILNFDEAVITGVGRITIKDYETESIVEEISINDAGQVVIVDSQITVTLSLSLEIGKRYYITVDNGSLEDAYGNVWSGISDKNTWSWTTYIEEVPFAYIVESEIYSSLSTKYANAARQINLMVDSLHEALTIVVELDDTETTIDLLNAFYNTWQDQRDAPTQNLSSTARFLNQYILNRTDYASINDFINDAEIQVSPEWAALSELVGFPIDPVYVAI